MAEEEKQEREIKQHMYHLSIENYDSSVHSPMKDFIFNMDEFAKDVLTDVIMIKVGLTVVCIMQTNRSGYSIVGSATCADPASFNEADMIAHAQQDALAKLSEHEIYMRHCLASQETSQEIFKVQSED